MCYVKGVILSTHWSLLTEQNIQPQDSWPLDRGLDWASAEHNVGALTAVP